jgi:tetratricopeptide (TPR) repeat protein
MQRRIAQPRYRFRHALIRATAYDTLLPSARENLHRRVAEVLEANFPDLVRTEPQVMAQHWAAAGAQERALSYAKRASMDLLLRSSHLELVEHSQLALSWLKNLPEAQAQAQTYHELDLTLPYLLASMSVRGYAEASISGIVERAEQLLEQAPEYAGSFNLLFAMGLFYHVQGTDRARALHSSERLAELIETRPAFRSLNVFAWTALANCHYANGDFGRAERFADQTCRAYEPSFHGPMAWRFGFDAWVAVEGIRVIMEWISGHLDRSHQRLQDLEKRANALGHPESITQAWFTICVLGHCRRDRDQLARGVQGLAHAAQEHRLGMYAKYSRLFAALLTHDTGAALSAVDELRIGGSVYSTSYQCSVLAEIELHNNDALAASEHVEHGIAQAESSGEKFWYPRLLCQRALVSHRLGRPGRVTLAALNAASSDAHQRDMSMFELEAQVIHSTVSSERPSMDWHGAGLQLSKDAVLKALESLRRNYTDQRLVETKTASAQR